MLYLISNHIFPDEKLKQKVQIEDGFIYIMN